jgi:hypothetical protein
MVCSSLVCAVVVDGSLPSADGGVTSSPVTGPSSDDVFGAAPPGMCGCWPVLQGVCVASRVVLAVTVAVVTPTAAGPKKKQRGDGPPSLRVTTVRNDALCMLWRVCFALIVDGVAR